MEGQGPALVLIHGWGLDMSMWDEQVNILSWLHTILRYDRRGFGHSTGMPSVASDVEDLTALLDALKIDRAAILGMSQGGRAALRFAVANPHRTDALVLHGAPLDGFPIARKGIDEIPVGRYRTIAQTQGMDAFRRELMTHPAMTLYGDDPQTVDKVMAMLGRYRGDDLLAAAPPADPSQTVLPPLGDVACPTLVILGEHESAWLNLVADTLVYAMPDARKLILPGAGHLANLDAPALYSTHLSAFLLTAATKRISHS